MNWNRFKPSRSGGGLRSKAHASFNNVRGTCPSGHSHASKLESSVCSMLYLRMKAGEFREILVEQVVYLTEARIEYRADFCCEKVGGQLLYVEAKGYEDKKWPIKKRLWKFYGPAPLEIWKGSAARPLLDEVIVPKGFV